MMLMQRADVSGRMVSGDSVSGRLSAPWWKEPLMWLVLGLPASVVVAGIYTIILASRSMP